MYETEKRVLSNEAQNPDPAYDSFAICHYICCTMEHFSLTHIFSYTGGIMAGDHILLRETMQLP